MHSGPFPFLSKVLEGAHFQDLDGIWIGNVLSFNALSRGHNPGGVFFEKLEEIAVHGGL